MQQPIFEEQTFIDATMNARLAEAWQAGATWAATDFYGRPMTLGMVTLYLNTLIEVRKLTVWKGLFREIPGKLAAMSPCFASGICSLARH